METFPSVQDNKGIPTKQCAGNLADKILCVLAHMRRLRSNETRWRQCTQSCTHEEVGVLQKLVGMMTDSEEPEPSPTTEASPASTRCASPFVGGKSGAATPASTRCSSPCFRGGKLDSPTSCAAIVPLTRDLAGSYRNHHPSAISGNQFSIEPRVSSTAVHLLHKDPELPCRSDLSHNAKDFQAIRLHRAPSAQSYQQCFGAIIVCCGQSRGRCPSRFSR